MTEDTFDAVADRAAKANIFTRGPMGSRGKGRAMFMLDPDGNETEVNTRYLYVSLRLCRNVDLKIR